MINLTEKWKKGELPSGWYYVQLKDGTYVDGKKSVIMDYLFEFTNDFERHPYLIEQVLAPVPSYNEYMTMKDCAKKEYEAHGVPLPSYDEWKQLKELLKECSPYVSRSATSRIIKNSVGFKKDMKLLTKIDEVLK